MKLSASIMAHPDRAGQVTELRGALDRNVPVNWDHYPGPPSGKGDRVWAVARGAWLMFEHDADWHVLIQDDAVPCRDLLGGLERALQYVPDRCLVSPYLGKGRMVPARWGRMAQSADATGACWIRTDRMRWGVCLAAPTKMIPEMISWCDRKAGMPDDMRVGAWFQRQGLEVWYTWPSLVDHRPGMSLTKHRASDRVARRHHQGSALDIDWAGPVVTDPMHVRRLGQRSGPSAGRRHRGTAPLGG